MNGFGGKSAVVTGAAKGLGRSTAANNADIPVHTLDLGAEGTEGGDLASVVESNNAEAGKKGANYIVDLLRRPPQGALRRAAGQRGRLAGPRRHDRCRRLGPAGLVQGVVIFLAVLVDALNRRRESRAG